MIGAENSSDWQIEGNAGVDPITASFANQPEYLALQGIHATERVVDPKMQGASETLMESAIAGGADMLVMGGYGHSHWREVFLGGVTQHVRWHARLPVLMAH